VCCQGKLQDSTERNDLCYSLWPIRFKMEAVYFLSTIGGPVGGAMNSTTALQGTM
jgi:hypothetical protein